MAYDLRPYQIQAVDKQLTDRRILLADDMGMGKCLEVIAAKPFIDKEIGYRPTLIISPGAVIPHWEREIRKWHYKGGKTIIVPLDVSGSLVKDIQSAQGAEFVLAPYSLLSALGNYPGALEALLHMNFSQGVLDEGHLTSNPASLRTQSARALFHHIPYLSILTGTPIPNTVIDIYSQMNLLDREAFPLEEMNENAMVESFYQIIRDKPHLVRDILQSRMLRRTAEEYLGKKMPRLDQRSIEIRLSGEHETVYESIYENDNIPVSSKLWELMKVSLDPNLANRNYLPPSLQQRLGKMDSCTFDRLEEEVDRSINKDKGKFLCFTDLKVGVIPAIQERFKKYGVLAVTQEVSPRATRGKISPREEMRRKFQFDQNYNFMIATNVMDVGVDLTGATDIGHLTLPFMPAPLDQRIRRSQRMSAEIEKESLTSMIFTPVMSNGAPTINEGVMQLLDDKRRIIRYVVESPEKLTLEDLDQIKKGSPEKSPTLAGFLSLKSSMDWHLVSLRGRGGAQILSEYQNKPYLAQNLAHAYSKYWEGYFGGNAATLSAAVVRQLLGGDVSEKSMVDICSGPFSLSRRLGFPVTNLDLNEYMLQAGKLLEEQNIIPQGNIAHQGLANNLPFGDGEFDLANCSLALHMSTLADVVGNGRSEREEIFREAHRVSEMYVFTLPPSVLHRRDMSTFALGLAQMGWDVLPQTGFYRGNGDSRFKVFLGALQKNDQGSDEAVPEEFLRWNMDDRFAKKRKGRTTSPRKGSMLKKKKDKFELVPEFVHEDSGLTLLAGGSTV